MTGACLVRRYIDLCADFNDRRRSLLTVESCQDSQYFFGHLPLENGTVQLTINNLTAGAPTMLTEPCWRLWEGVRVR